MALESGTWVDDLVVTNPPSTDDKRQGDDHLRLIKTVLKNTFKRTSGRPIFFPTSVALSASYTILDTDESTIFRCNTVSGPLTLTLPNTLTASNAGWRIFIVKTNVDNIPLFIVPPTGLLDGFTKVRRTAENKRTEVMWTGTGWVITRPDSTPIGTTHEYYGTTLPNGYLWPDGTTFIATDFVELNTILGTNTKPDLRGRTSFGKDDMGGPGAGRITVPGSGIAGTTLRAAGGTETHTLTSAQLAQHNHGVTESPHSHGAGTLGTDTHAGHQHDAFTRENNHAHSIPATLASGSSATNLIRGDVTGAIPIPTSFAATGLHVNSVSGGGAGTDDKVALGGVHSHAITTGASATSTTGLTINNFPTIAGAAHQNTPPGIICNKIIVAE